MYALLSRAYCHGQFDGPSFSVVGYPVFITSRRYECISHSPRPASSLPAMLSGTLEFACTCSPVAREPEIVNCQVGHVKCFVCENSQLKREN